MLFGVNRMAFVYITHAHIISHALVSETREQGTPLHRGVKQQNNKQKMGNINTVGPNEALIVSGQSYGCKNTINSS